MLGNNGKKYTNIAGVRTLRFGWFAIDEEQYYDLSKVETEIRGNEKPTHTGKSTLTICVSVCDSLFRRIRAFPTSSSSFCF